MSNLLPAKVIAAAQALTDPSSIQLFQQIRYQEIELQGQTMATSYVRAGQQGTPILLLHGFDSSVLEFRRLLPLLALQQETWALDLLGFGFGARSPQITYSPNQITAHLQAFWQSQIQQPMVLVGASMGGAAAIDFALQHPQSVAHLVLIDSAGLQQPPQISKFMVPPLDRWITAFLGNPRIRQSISKSAYFDPHYASEDARLCAALHLECDHWSTALIRFTKSGGYGNYGDRLHQIQQPTSILWGKSDRILGTKDAQKFHRLIPRSQLTWLDRCGHVPHLEQPQATAAAILRCC
jgi:pimeloyl-ACP methyl ester carboxylesterase